MNVWLWRVYVYMFCIVYIYFRSRSRRNSHTVRKVQTQSRAHLAANPFLIVFMLQTIHINIGRGEAHLSAFDATLIIRFDQQIWGGGGDWGTEGRAAPAIRVNIMVDLPLDDTRAVSLLINMRESGSFTRLDAADDRECALFAKHNYLNLSVSIDIRLYKFEWTSYIYKYIEGRLMTTTIGWLMNIKTVFFKPKHNLVGFVYRNMCTNWCRKQKCILFGILPLYRRQD